MPPMQRLPLAGSFLACFLQLFGPLGAQKRSVGRLNEQSHVDRRGDLLVKTLNTSITLTPTSEFRKAQGIKNNESDFRDYNSDSVL